MTVQSTTARADYLGNGTTTLFTVPFYFLDNAHLKVLRTDNSTSPPTTALLVLESDYVVTGAGVESGGSVQTTVAPAPTQTLTILRNVPFTQLVHYVPNDPFPAASHEQALDQLTMEVQQIGEAQTHSLQIPTYEPTPPTLAAASIRAGSVLGFDANGNVTYLHIPAAVGAGDMRDEIGSDGEPGFVAGTDFTAGVTTQLTLSRAPGSKSNVWVQFDGGYQGGDQIQSIVGTVLTFTAPIPAGIQRVYVRTGTTLSLNQPAQGSVVTDSIADDAVTLDKMAPGSVGNTQLIDGSVTLPKLASGSVNDSKVVTGSKLFNRINDSVSITDFGGSTANPDNSAALLAALAACPAGRKHVYIPAGKWRFASNTAYTMTNTIESVTIIGAGPDATELTWSSGDGLRINVISAFNSVHIRDLSFTTSAIGGGTALKINQTAASILNPAFNALSDITNVTIRGADGYVISACWAIGIYLTGVSNVNFYGVTFDGGAGPGGVGTGLQIEGSASLPPVQFNLTSCFFNWNQVGFQYGNYVQGVSIAQCNFVGGAYGVVTQPGLTELDQLTVTASQFNQTVANILENTNVSNTMVIGNVFIIQSGAIGIGLPAAGFYSILGNTMSDFVGASNKNGIVINGSTGPGVITGNTFLRLTTAVNLQAGSTAVNVQANSYAANSNDVVNLGTGNTVGGGSQ